MYLLHCDSHFVFVSISFSVEIYTHIYQNVYKKKELIWEEKLSGILFFATKIPIPLCVDQDLVDQQK